DLVVGPERARPRARLVEDGDAGAPEERRVAVDLRLDEPRVERRALDDGGVTAGGAAEVAVDRGVGPTVEDEPAVVEQQRAGAEPAHRREVVADEDDGPPFTRDVAHLAEA